MNFKNGGTSPKVLIVDDLADARESLALIFKLYGWQDPVLAANLTEGIAHGPDCDIAILDLGLPDYSRDEVVKKFTSSCKDTPVIVVTGDNDYDVGIACVKDGAQDFFCKPDTEPKAIKKAAEYAIERNKRLTLQIAVHEAGELCAMILDGIGKLRKVLMIPPDQNGEAK